MDTITLNGKVVSKSQNLRGILEYARKHAVKSTYVNHKPEGKAQVRFTFDNGAESLTNWESFTVAIDWIRQRRSWGIEPQFDMLTMFDPDLYDTDQGDLSPKDYRDIVSHPGKFEGEPRYIPYMWDNILNWGDVPDSDKTIELWANEYGYDDLDHEMGDWSSEGLPEVYRYDVDLIDYLMFPELLGSYWGIGLYQAITTVYLYESDQGFVNVYDYDTVELSES